MWRILVTVTVNEQKNKERGTRLLVGNSVENSVIGNTSIYRSIFLTDTLFETRGVLMMGA